MAINTGDRLVPVKRFVGKLLSAKAFGQHVMKWILLLTVAGAFLAPVWCLEDG